MMNDALECPTLTGGDAIHLYVAGKLAPAEVEAFELHLLGCERCRAAVRQGAAVAAALRSRRRVSPWRYLIWAAPLAAVLAGLLLLRARSPLVRMGDIVAAPPFAGMAVRGAPGSDALLVDSGMAAYAAGRWAEAARLLGRADGNAPGASASAPGPGPAFYLGLARLMAGDPRGALAPLARAALPESPYSADASYFRAKAWLRLKEPDSALAALQASAADSTAAARATALADSVRQARRE